MAAPERSGNVAGLVFHSDRGSPAEHKAAIHHRADRQAT